MVNEISREILFFFQYFSISGFHLVIYFMNTIIMLYSYLNFNIYIFHPPCKAIMPLRWNELREVKENEKIRKMIKNGRVQEERNLQ